MASLFPREEHAEALFHRILSNPGAEQQLYETFCMEQENASFEDGGGAECSFAKALLQAYENRDISALTIALCNNTMFDLLRTAYLIPYRFHGKNGVNTSKLNRLEQFVAEFADICSRMTGEQLHTHLDEIEQVHGLYSPLMLGLAAALACGAFTFLLGGGWVEMILAFFGAGIGNAVRCKLSKHHLTLVLCTTVSVAAACLVYAGCLKIAEMTCGINVQHEAGYICSMLFIIPGFPFITSGIDMAKLDMRSGLERLSYAVMIVLIATMAAWLMALALHLKPVDFLPLNLSMLQYIVFRLLASFCGVFGFSIMFNSPVPLAMSAAVIGAISNTLRLELVDLASLPPAAAAFFAAMIAGLLASAYKKHSGFPRIAITVPSIVIMVPGLYLYRAIYNLGMMNLSISASWFASATLIILALPLGLIFARIMTDKMFRYCT